MVCQLVESEAEAAVEVGVVRHPEPGTASARRDPVDVEG